MVAEKQLEILKITISNLIIHRETITDNSEEFTVEGMEALTEPIDASILAAIDSIKEIKGN
jgi:hypothetical protein